jgi:hypothetical protein
MKHHIFKIVSVVLGVILVYTLSTEDQRLEARVIGVTAQCANGSFTTAKRGPGVCSAHGGVQRWIEK